MNGLVYTLALLMLLAPAATAVSHEAKGPDLLDETACDFFSYTLTPPDYRLDEDCLEDSLTP